MPDLQQFAVTRTGSTVNANVPECSVVTCGNAPYSGGFCGAHYKRWKRYGDPNAGGTFYGLSVEERFWAKVNKDGSIPAHRPDLGACWIWTAGKDREGYGRLAIDRVAVAAHVVAYRLLIGEIPERLELDHLCRNRGCVRPHHLEPVTHQENVRRGAACYGDGLTECPNGHPLDESNAYQRTDNAGIKSRACRRERDRARRLARA